MQILKVISLLLDYPTEALQGGRDELVAAISAAREISPQQRAALLQLLDTLAASDLMDIQERYSELFDKGRSLSLLMFEHVHGESRDRGQAMVDLIDAYRKNGFELDARELPDYLPLLLEYLSQRPQQEARDWLQHVSHIIGLLAARAGERESSYAVLLEILVEYAEGKLDLGSLRKRASEEPRDDTPDVMDKLWEDEAVRFGNEAPDENCAPPTRITAHAAARQVQP